MPDYLTIEHLKLKEIKRIFKSIEIDPVTDCWNWTASLSGKGAKTGKGYARIGFRGHSEAVYRILYAWLVEPIPRGCGRDIPVLDHVVCSNTRCCNPLHVEPSTHLVNILRGDGVCAQNARKTECPKGISYRKSRI